MRVYVWIIGRLNTDGGSSILYYSQYYYYYSEPGENFVMFVSEKERVIL